MPNLAAITIAGHLGKDPELKTGETAVCKFSVAVKTRAKKNGEWTDMTTWWSVTCFGKVAEFAAKDLTKGAPVLLSGEASVEEYTAKDGTKRQVACVNANKVQSLARREQRQAVTAASPAPVAVTNEDSEPPF